MKSKKDREIFLLKATIEEWQIIAGLCITVGESKGKLDNDTKEVFRSIYFWIKEELKEICEW